MQLMDKAAIGAQRARDRAPPIVIVEMIANPLSSGSDRA